MIHKCASFPLPYITWGLVWYLKTKRGDSDTYIKINDTKTKRRKEDIINTEEEEDI